MGSAGKTAHHTYATAPTAPPQTGASPTGAPPSGEPATEPADPAAAGAWAGQPPPAGQESGTGTGHEAETAPPFGTGAAQETAPDSHQAGQAQLLVDPPPDVVTPIPQTPPEGAAAGVPVLIGGADLADATATLVSYTSPHGHGPREVLLATLEENAEAKLIEALALNEEELIPVQVQEQVSGRLPMDEAKQLHELVAKAAKSVNHKLKNGQEIPEHTKEYLTSAQTAVQQVLADPAASQDEKTMAGYYQQHLEAIAQRVADPLGRPYAEGGKIPQVDPYLHSGPATVTKLVPAPLQEPAPGLLAATLRKASRIKARIDPVTGTASWDGTARSPAAGTEYAIDMGQGWTALYRPYGANDPAKHEYSLRGQLEVHAPQGAGHGQELVRRLSDLHLVNRAMTRAEGEWTYLKNNIDAQQLTAHPGVSSALAQADELQELQLQELFHTHADQAVGLDQPALAALAKRWQIEASAACLPKKVRMVREAVAAATGYSDGAALAASPGYDPTPKATGGWLTWGRFDLGNRAPQIDTAWKGKSLVHRISGGNIADLLATGVLASTERRTVMGIQPGKGTSEAADKYSGGANAVFTRVRTTTAVGSGPRLVWDDPPRLLNNTNIYGYGSDHFGALNPKSHHSTTGLTTDPLEMADFTAHDNEVMFKHGLDLLGAQAPSRIICGSTKQKTKVLALLNERGITHLAGKPVDQVVQ